MALASSHYSRVSRGTALADRPLASAHGLHIGDQFIDGVTNNVWDLGVLPGAAAGNRANWDWTLCCQGNGTTAP